MIAQKYNSTLSLRPSSEFEHHSLSTSEAISSLCGDYETVFLEQISFGEVCVRDIPYIFVRTIVLKSCQHIHILFAILRKYETLKMTIVVNGIESASLVNDMMSNDFSFRFHVRIVYSYKFPPFVMELTGCDNERTGYINTEINGCNKEIKTFRQRNIKAFKKCHDAVFLICGLLKYKRLNVNKDIGLIVIQYIWNTRGTKHWI